MAGIKDRAASGLKAVGAGIAGAVAGVADAAEGVGKAAIGLVAGDKAPAIDGEDGEDKTPRETRAQMAQKSDTKSKAAAQASKPAAKGRTPAAKGQTPPAKGRKPPAKGRAKAQKPAARPIPAGGGPRREPAVRVAILDAGAVGGYMGLHLANSGVRTTLIAREPHLSAMQKNGVAVLTKKDNLTAYPFCTGVPAEAGPQDYVIVMPKPQSGAETVEAIKPLLGPGTTVVTAQTGMPWWYFYRSGGEFDGSRLESVDPDGALWDQVGPERAVGCVVKIAAKFPAPGVIRHQSGDRIVLGEPSGEKTKRVETLSGLLTEAGFKSPVTASIRDELWNELWGLLAFDSISVLTSTAAAKISDDAGVRAIAKAMTVEAQQVGKALGVKFGGSAEKQIKTAADRNGPLGPAARG